MKFVHLSDLHIGKRFFAEKLIEDQKHILQEICQIAADENPDAIVIAGDIYDKSVPPLDAVPMLDDFLFQLRRYPVLMISGNHDSAERVAFASRQLKENGLHISPVYDGSVAPIILQDEHGPVNFYMLPFIKPVHVRQAFPDEESEINSYTDALRVAIAHMNVDYSQRNVLITHQFITGSERSDSEENVGGADNVDASVLAGFDYVALGHLHGPQNVGSERIRYCGTPLKYSFSEINQEKSVSVITLGAKGEFALKTVPLHPLRDLRRLRGTYMELTDRQNYVGTDTDAYMHITLTDEQDIPDAMARLRTVYPNLMVLDYDNTRTRTHSNAISGAEQVQRKSPLTLFEELYQQQNGQPLTDEQSEFMHSLIESIWEEE